ncbi:MAG TPA: hypothetical protein VFV52_18420 [Bacilli bacterium]|nr:hypothetical protein [Bacilli bacterium]
MNQPQLLCLEGLSGSGKSSFSRFIKLQAERNGIDVIRYHEVAKGHPTHFMEEACLTGEEFAHLLPTTRKHVRFWKKWRW